MSVIQKLVGTVINTGKKLKHEDSIQASTKALFDARWGFGGGEKTLGDGGVVQSLVASPVNTATASGTGSITYTGTAGNPKTNGGGWKFTKGDGKSRFNLSADAVPKFTDTHWFVQQYVKLDEYAQAGSNNSIINIGSTTTSSANSNFGIQVVSSDGLVVTGVNFFIRGLAFQIISSTTNATTIFEKFEAGQNKKLLIGAECIVGATQTTFKLYLDGVLSYNYAINNASTAITNSTMSWNCTASYPAHIAGTFYRYRFDDLTNSVLSVDELVALEYQACLEAFVV